jgi:vacuolar-type H+-ATPase subunit E/Vma4
VGLAEIVQRIAADAEEQSDRIVSEARERAADIAARTKAESSAAAKAALSEAEARAARERAHSLAEARLAARNQVLEEKRAALDEVEALARELVGQSSTERYLKILAAAVAARASGDETVVFDPSDTERLGQDLLRSANDELARLGKRAELSSEGGSADLGGAGLMLLGDGSEERITPASVVAEARIALEPEVARALFADGGEG